MVFSRSDRLVLVISIGFALLAAGTAYTSNPYHRLRAPSQAIEGPLDLNKSSFSELLRLPGIGPALAQRIILYRERYGPFRDLKELMNVEGIGPTLLEGLQGRLRVGESGDHD